MLVTLAQWGKPIAKVVVVMMFSLNILPQVLAASNDYHANGRTFSGAINTIASQSIDQHDCDHTAPKPIKYHGGLEDCHGLMCVSSLLPEQPINIHHVTVLNVHGAPAEHRALSSPAPLRRPPRILS